MHINDPSQKRNPLAQVRPAAIQLPAEREIERRLGDFLRSKGAEVYRENGSAFIVALAAEEGFHAGDDPIEIEITLADLAQFVAQLLP